MGLGNCTPTQQINRPSRSWRDFSQSLLTATSLKCAWEEFPQKGSILILLWKACPSLVLKIRNIKWRLYQTWFTKVVFVLKYVVNWYPHESEIFVEFHGKIIRWTLLREIFMNSLEWALLEIHELNYNETVKYITLLGRPIFKIK